MSEGFRRGDRVRIRGERWYVVACADDVIRVRGCDAANRLTETAFLAGVEPMQRLPRRSVRVVTAARWRSMARRVMADATPSPAALRTAARARFDLLPFQLEPALAWTHGKGVRFLIADDVGLGKTVQAGLLMAEMLARSPAAHVLVVTPAGLREQWIDELRSRFALTVAMIDSAALARLSSAVLAGANPWTTAAVSVASIDFIKRAEVLRSLEAVVWDLVVFDEAHALCGHSDRATASALLAERARTLVLLSATPHSGDVDAFERLMAIGALDRQFPILAFRRTRLDAGFVGARRNVWLRVRLTPAEREMHRALGIYTRAIWTSRGQLDPGARLAALVLARRACSSPAALARSLDRRMSLLAHAEGPPPQLRLPFADDHCADDAALATPGLVDAGEERRVLERLVGLAQAAAAYEGKCGALRRLLQRVAEPAIVFTEYRDTLDHLAQAFASMNPVQLHGGMTASERRDVLRQFTRGHASLLLATDAASEGLNLQHRCRLVINLELPWSPVRLEQRIGRVDRLGQTRRVHAVHLVGRETAEERTILSLLARATRAGHALAAMRPAVSDDQIAAAVVGGASIAAPPATSPTGMTVCDLRDAARVEAARVWHCRALDQHAAAAVDDRPVVAAGRRGPSACCAYRVLLDDRAGDPLWEGVIGLTANTRVSADTRIKDGLAAVETAMAPWLEQAADRMATTVAASCGAALDVAIQRELAIERTLRIGRSRMASEMVQRGLFDARTERAAAARTRVLQDALDACEQHLASLRRRQHVLPAGTELAFAILPG